MMKEKEALDREELIQALRKVGAYLRERKSFIRDLDARAGDGDLGITVDKGFKAVDDFLVDGEDSKESLGDLLKRSGMEFNSAAASTCGVFFATAFMKAGEVVGEREAVDLPLFSQMVDAAVGGIKDRGGAQLGDRTLLDALVPAAASLRESKEEGKGLAQALDRASMEAKKGAERTEGMEPKKGRAKQLGESVKEVKDPGATVVAFFFEGFAELFAKE